MSKPTLVQRRWQRILKQVLELHYPLLFRYCLVLHFKLKSMLMLTQNQSTSLPAHIDLKTAQICSELHIW